VSYTKEELVIQIKLAQVNVDQCLVEPWPISAWAP